MQTPLGMERVVVKRKKKVEGQKKMKAQQRLKEQRVVGLKKMHL